MSDLLAKVKQIFAVRFSLPEILTIALVFCLDRVTKFIVSAYPLGYSKKIFNFFYITYIHNTGAAFGMGQNLNLLFTLIAFVLIAALFYYKEYIYSHGRAARLALLFILGGALGNLYDRVLHGMVIDFLDFRIWPVFNIADSFISIGGVLLMWSMFFGCRKNEKN